MKIVATIEARMTSTRLPGKVLLPANGRPMLEHLVYRLQHVPSLDDIVLATTTNATDDVLVSAAQQLGIKQYRGSETDVLQRVIDAADSAQADVVVETLGDCPLLDPLLIEQVIQTFIHNDCDYAGNARVRAYPRGTEVQVFYLDALKKSCRMTSDPDDHEHVSLHMHNHPELFRQVNILPTPDMHWPQLGLTLDTQEDYILLKKIIEYFGDDHRLVSCREIIEVLRTKPAWVTINAAVARRG